MHVSCGGYYIGVPLIDFCWRQGRKRLTSGNLQALEPLISDAMLFLLEAGQVVVRLKRWKAGWDVLNDGEVVMYQGMPAGVSVIWCRGTMSPVLTIAPVLPVCKGKTKPPAVTGHYLEREISVFPKRHIL